MKDQQWPLRHRDLQLLHPPWDSVEAPLPPPSPRDRANVTHPLPSCVELELLDLPFSTSYILSGYEDDVIVRNDSFTLWTRIKIEELLVLHMVDAHRAGAGYREGAERKPDTSSPVHQTVRHATAFSTKQKRLSVYKWNPGARRGNADAFVKQIAGKWHIITLQEATEYVDHNAFMKRFHIIHYGGCAVLFNKDTFYSEIEANSIYLHDTRRGSHDQAAEGGQGWCMSGVLARATFKRRAANGSLCCACISATSLPRTEASPRSSSSRSVPSCLVNKLTWLLAISMGQRGGAATGAT